MAPSLHKFSAVLQIMHIFGASLKIDVRSASSSSGKELSDQHQHQTIKNTEINAQQIKFRFNAHFSWEISEQKKKLFDFVKKYYEK